MPITEEKKCEAEQNQDRVAKDTSSNIRLIAGPGTGKTSVIEKRVLWLLKNGVLSSNIFIISFTRASSLDLNKRIIDFCKNNGRIDVDKVNVSTLHSLVLRILRKANLLTYPGKISILDDWEIKNIFDKEFSVYSGYKNGKQIGGYTRSRCEDIRLDYEAFCGTETYEPANYILPNPPITQKERDDYQRFHNSRTNVYSCLLPGEIVQKCLEYMSKNILNPLKTINIQHLIVDEYQDLNPVDIKFIEYLTRCDVNTFIAGDDDQSIYSFRFALPRGIQDYDKRFSNVSTHSLLYCFRCTTKILKTGQELIKKYQDEYHVDKQLISLYETAKPPLDGSVHLWKFSSGQQEAKAIAESIDKLIKQGVQPNDIMILLADTKIQLKVIQLELENREILYESPKEKSFFDTDEGRFIIGIFRIILNKDDYLAYRLILGSIKGVGIETCNNIVSIVINNNINYKDIFEETNHDYIFSNKLINIINKVRKICREVSSWDSEDILKDRISEINQIVENTIGPKSTKIWENEIKNLPFDIQLKELLDYILSENKQQRENIIKDVYCRLQRPYDERVDNYQKVQIMTMHGAKGLDAKVVFIPGLEKNILPGDKRLAKFGLILEAARMLYVSITRSKVAVIISFAEYRYYYGKLNKQVPSDFSKNLGESFKERKNGLTDREIDEIICTIKNL